MLKYVDTQITFSEVPDEVALCINISNCPIHCPSCHSQYLWEDIGTELTEETLKSLIEANTGITCVCFMGGDNDVPATNELSKFVHANYDLHTCIEFIKTLDDDEKNQLINTLIVSLYSYITNVDYE